MAHKRQKVMCRRARQLRSALLRAPRAPEVKDGCYWVPRARARGGRRARGARRLTGPPALPEACEHPRFTHTAPPGRLSTQPLWAPGGFDLTEPTLRSHPNGKSCPRLRLTVTRRLNLPPTPAPVPSRPAPCQEGPRLEARGEGRPGRSEPRPPCPSDASPRPCSQPRPPDPPPPLLPEERASRGSSRQSRPPSCPPGRGGLARALDSTRSSSGPARHRPPRAPPGRFSAGALVGLKGLNCK